MILYIVLGVVLIISFITDIKKRKILNMVTLPAIIIGIFFYTVTLGWEGFLFSGKGLLVGLGLLLIPYLLGGMGAGDVKLMAAIGALTGSTFTFHSFIYTALIGGIIAFIIIIKSHGVQFSIKSFVFTILVQPSDLGSLVKNKKTNSSITFPYGIAIVLGTVCAFMVGGGFT